MNPNLDFMKRKRSKKASFCLPLLKMVYELLSAMDGTNSIVFFSVIANINTDYTDGTKFGKFFVLILLRGFINAIIFLESLSLISSSWQEILKSVTQHFKILAANTGSRTRK
jgi:hypothetical protein